MQNAALCSSDILRWEQNYMKSGNLDHRGRNRKPYIKLILNYITQQNGRNIKTFYTGKKSTCYCLFASKQFRKLTKTSRSKQIHFERFLRHTVYCHKITCHSDEIYERSGIFLFPHFLKELAKTTLLYLMTATKDNFPHKKWNLYCMVYNEWLQGYAVSGVEESENMMELRRGAKLK